MNRVLIAMDDTNNSISAPGTNNEGKSPHEVVLYHVQKLEGKSLLIDRPGGEVIMNRVLIAVDDTRDSASVLSTFYNSVKLPNEVVLLHVQRLEGKSLMIDMLGEAELSTLKESLEGTEQKEKLDRRATRILSHYRKELEGFGFTSVRTVVRAGHPVDEILNVAQEEKVDLVIVGGGGKKGLNRLITGSVSKELESRARVPVLLAKRVAMCEAPYTWKDAYTVVSVVMAVVTCLFLIGFIIDKWFLPY